MAGSRASNPNTAPSGSHAPGGKKASAAPRQDKEGATSSNYLQQTRADNPEPSKSPDAGGVRLSECRFDTPVDKLRPSGEFEMSCKVEASGSEPPKDLSVIFRLYCTGVNAKGAKVEEDLKANWSAKLAKKTGSQVVKAKGTLFRPKTLKGPSLEYHLVAEHPGAKEKCVSAKVAVGGKIQIQSESLLLDHFDTHGVIPILDVLGKLPKALASAIQAASKIANGGQKGTMLIQGHSDSSDAQGQERSKLRAQTIQSILAKDEAGFVRIASKHGSTTDFYRNLSALARCGWDCDPKQGNAVAFSEFKDECKLRFGIKIPESNPGPQSWKALHRSMVWAVQKELGEDGFRPPVWISPVWAPVGNGIFGWGKEAPPTSSPAGRSVDLCLYFGQNPGITCPAPGMLPSIALNPLEDASKSTKSPLDSTGKKSPPKFDIAKMVAHANANAEDESQGKCSKYVRLALEAGGGDTSGHPVYAKNWGPTLIKMGFVEVSKEGYTPKLGDVVVLNPPVDDSKPGHIQIFNGSIWVSDFNQSADIWPGKAYRTAKKSYWIYRYTSP